ncbi:MAG TPA: SRPBCC family protein [Candidatus Dormibacteraeota bacterium]|nr:SRPBCC family protein [Candidatus Dormibacteraeota bacterium]
MPSYDASISIAAAPASVWPVLSDVARWPQWLPTVSSVEPLDGEPLSRGGRYRVLQPKLRPATWVVSAVSAPNRFVWESRSPGVLVVADHIIEEPSPGTSHVVLRVSFSGLLGFLVGRLARSITERYLAQEAAALKRKVEGGNASVA